MRIGCPALPDIRKFVKKPFHHVGKSSEGQRAGDFGECAAEITLFT